MLVTPLARLLPLSWWRFWVLVAPWERLCLLSGTRGAFALETLVGAGGTVDRYIAVALVALGVKFCWHPIGVWWAFPS